MSLQDNPIDRLIGNLNSPILELRSTSASSLLSKIELSLLSHSTLVSQFHFLVGQILRSVNSHNLNGDPSNLAKFFQILVIFNRSEEGKSVLEGYGTRQFFGEYLKHCEKKSFREIVEMVAEFLRILDSGAASFERVPAKPKKEMSVASLGLSLRGIFEGIIGPSEGVLSFNKVEISEPDRMRLVRLVASLKVADPNDCPPHLLQELILALKSIPVSVFLDSFPELLHETSRFIFQGENSITTSSLFQLLALSAKRTLEDSKRFPPTSRSTTSRFSLEGLAQVLIRLCFSINTKALGCFAIDDLSNMLCSLEEVEEQKIDEMLFGEFLWCQEIFSRIRANCDRQTQIKLIDLSLELLEKVKVKETMNRKIAWSQIRQSIEAGLIQESKKKLLLELSEQFEPKFFEFLKFYRNVGGAIDQIKALNSDFLQESSIDARRQLKRLESFVKFFHENVESFVLSKFDVVKLFHALFASKNFEFENEILALFEPSFAAFLQGAFLFHQPSLYSGRVLQVVIEILRDNVVYQVSGRNMPTKVLLLQFLSRWKVLNFPLATLMTEKKEWAPLFSETISIIFSSSPDLSEYIDLQPLLVNAIQNKTDRDVLLSNSIRLKEKELETFINLIETRDKTCEMEYTSELDIERIRSEQKQSYFEKEEFHALYDILNIFSNRHLDKPIRLNAIKEIYKESLIKINNPEARDFICCCINVVKDQITEEPDEDIFLILVLLVLLFLRSPRIDLIQKTKIFENLFDKVRSNDFEFLKLCASWTRHKEIRFRYHVALLIETVLLSPLPLLKSIRKSTLMTKHYSHEMISKVPPNYLSGGQKEIIACVKLEYGIHEFVEAKLERKQVQNLQSTDNFFAFFEGVQFICRFPESNNDEMKFWAEQIFEIIETPENAKKFSGMFEYLIDNPRFLASPLRDLILEKLESFSFYLLREKLLSAGLGLRLFHLFDSKEKFLSAIIAEEELLSEPKEHILSIGSPLSDLALSFISKRSGLSRTIFDERKIEASLLILLKNFNTLPKESIPDLIVISMTFIPSSRRSLQVIELAFCKLLLPKLDFLIHGYILTKLKQTCFELIQLESKVISALAIDILTDILKLTKIFDSSLLGISKEVVKIHRSEEHDIVLASSLRMLKEILAIKPELSDEFFQKNHLLYKTLSRDSGVHDGFLIKAILDLMILSSSDFLKKSIFFVEKTISLVSERESLEQKSSIISSSIRLLARVPQSVQSSETLKCLALLDRVDRADFKSIARLIEGVKRLDDIKVGRENCVKVVLVRAHLDMNVSEDILFLSQLIASSNVGKVFFLESDYLQSIFSILRYAHKTDSKAKLKEYLHLIKMLFRPLSEPLRELGNEARAGCDLLESLLEFISLMNAKEEEMLLFGWLMDVHAAWCSNSFFETFFDAKNKFVVNSINMLAKNLESQAGLITLSFLTKSSRSTRLKTLVIKSKLIESLNEKIASVCLSKITPKSLAIIEPIMTLYTVLSFDPLFHRKIVADTSGFESLGIIFAAGGETIQKKMIYLFANLVMTKSIKPCFFDEKNVLKRILGLIAASESLEESSIVIQFVYNMLFKDASLLAEVDVEEFGESLEAAKKARERDLDKAKVTFNAEAEKEARAILQNILAVKNILLAI